MTPVFDPDRDRTFLCPFCESNTHDAEDCPRAPRKRTVAIIKAKAFPVAGKNRLPRLMDLEGYAPRSLTVALEAAPVDPETKCRFAATHPTRACVAQQFASGSLFLHAPGYTVHDREQMKGEEIWLPLVAARG